MEFKAFQNKNHYLEYLQIFCFYELILNSKNSIRLRDYKTFELTDGIIEKYNCWINQEANRPNNVARWFQKNPDAVRYFKSHFPEKFKPKVAIWSDRNKTAYYKDKLQDSFIFENYIAGLLKAKFNLDIGAYLTPEGQYELGENALGIEIKNDTLIEKYGNLYIEYQEKSAPHKEEYVNSGILKKDNCSYFLTGTERQFYIFRKSALIRILKEELQNFSQNIPSSRHIQFKKIATSKGFVFPVKYASKETISLEKMIEEIKKNT
ncbi:MAG: hypothetical protein K9I29_09475 [Bacteroidales bacterium]|nr:hypothetical protein [Bacteroidales bacterium]MCF8328508.1 hypothetical protein [Bacteroidales bacterium]